MPILRHECRSCGVEIVDLYPSTDAAPECCGSTMRRLMPKRVVGRCVADSNGAHAGSGFAVNKPAAPPTVPAIPSSAPVFDLPEGRAVQIGKTEDYEAKYTRSRFVSTPIDYSDERALPHAPHTGVFAKDYEQCTASERDARWRDGVESLAAWATRGLEAKGEAPRAARDTAQAEAVKTITKARSESTRADGLT